MEAPNTPHQMAKSVLEVLAGFPLHQAAACIGMEPDDLADAVEVYQAAGHAALEAQAEAARGWYSVSIQFADWDTAEHIAANLLDLPLRKAKHKGVLAGWWFIRKHPSWRLRCRPCPTATRADVEDAVSTILDSLVADGLVERWWETVYEPEALVFGGPQGMDIAHDLFHADSCCVLDYARRHDPTTKAEHTLGRRELSVLLCNTLFCGAGQEPHERGDIWHRVEQLRLLPSDTPAHRLSEMTEALQLLMNLDTSPSSPLFNAGSPLAFIAPWAAAFDDAGRRLGGAARDDTLKRGVRDVLAHHVIFAWNRFGLDSGTQGILARAARDTVMNTPTPLPDTRLAEGS